MMVRAHYLHATDLTTEALSSLMKEKDNFDDDESNSGLRRYNNQELHPGQISNIPGLNPMKISNTPEMKPGHISNIPGLNPVNQQNNAEAYRQQQQKKTTMMIGSSFRRQKKDILTHDEFKAMCNTADRLTFTESTKTNPTTSLSSTSQEKEIINEIPLIDQMISHHSSRGDSCINKRKVRPELVPVDDKMKLYFAYNRKTGSISRVIATAPRAHFAHKGKSLQKQHQ